MAAAFAREHACHSSQLSRKRRCRAWRSCNFQYVSKVSRFGHYKISFGGRPVLYFLIKYFCITGGYIANREQTTEGTLHEFI